MEHSVTIKYNKIFFLGKRKRKSSITPARISIRHGTDERIRERQTINCRDQYTKLYFTDYYFPHRPSYSLVEQQPEEKRKQAPRLTRSISWRAGQISQRAAEFCCPFARTKGFVSSIIKTLRFSPPQRSASGLFRQWRIVQSSLETSSLDPHNHERTCVRARYQTMAIPTREPNPPQPSTDILCPWRWGGFWSRFDGGGWIGRRKWNRKWDGSVER